MEDLSKIKKVYSKTSLFYLCIVGITVVLQLIFAGVMIASGKDTASLSPLVLMLASVIPMWLIAMPICLVLMKKYVQGGEPQWAKQDAFIPEEKPFTSVSFLKCFCIAIFLMYVGNIVGVTIAGMLNVIPGVGLENTTIDLIGEQDLTMNIILTGILGPIVEEFMFRKVLIDGIGRYSRKMAIILSGIMFGLFHMNLYQMFYAAFLGMLLAYIYVRTGKIWITMLLHITINLLQGVVPLVLLQKLDLDGLINATSGEMTQEAINKVMEIAQSPAFLAFIIYIMAVFVFFLIGLVLFYKNVHKYAEIEYGEAFVNKGDGRKSLLNVGMIIYTIGCIGMIFLQ